MPPVGNLYPNSGKQAKRVENPGVTGWKSLPKWRIFLIWVENPGDAFGKSLPKQRIFLILVEIPDAAVREFLPKRRKSTEKGRDSR